MINKNYLNNLEKLKEHFLKNKSLILYEFFNDYETIKNKILNLKYSREYDPIKFSYSKSEFKINYEILEFLDKLLDVKINDNFEAYCFNWKDYTILCDKIKHEKGINVIIDFTDDWDFNYGGSIVYTDGSGNYTKIEPSGNTLIIFDIDNNKRFVQYINNLAKSKSRYFILGSFKY